MQTEAELELELHSNKYFLVLKLLIICYLWVSNTFFGKKCPKLANSPLSLRGGGKNIILFEKINVQLVGTGLYNWTTLKKLIHY